ncbi:MAG: hypothetical protein NTW86_06285 [Candidatus Sumerlaeota bacterium]|nr:hypothetical protein [Candidatus Sumerlaeota bacterium]
MPVNRRRYRGWRTILLLLGAFAGLARGPVLGAPAGNAPLRIRSINLYDPYATGDQRWPASRECPTFEAWIDQLARNGINEVVLSATMFPPMDLVDLAAIGYPEAVEYPKENVEERRATLDHNAAYAASKGVRLLIAGYEHNCPARFYFAHQEELNPGGRFTEPMSKHAGLSEKRIQKERVVGNISWNRPLYRKFWTDSYRALFEALPHVPGIRLTYGEWAWAYEDTPHDENLRDYLANAWQVVREARGNTGVLELTDWYVKTAELANENCPRPLVMAKDSGSDAGSPLVAPWVQDYVKAGVPFLGELDLSNSENTRPILWFDPDFIRDRVANLAQAGAEGCRARTGEPGHFVTSLEYCAVKAIAAEGKPFSADDAIAVLRPRFGDAAPHVFRALERSGFLLREYTKLYSGRLPWWQSDAVSINALATGFRGFQGFLDPLDHLRRDAVGLPDYISYLTTDAAHKAAYESRWREEHLLPPPVILERIRAAGVAARDEARAALKAAPPETLADDEEPLQELAASAFMAYHASRLFGAYVEMATDYWRLKQGDPDAALRGDILEKMDQAATEWAIIGRIGDAWFPKWINAPYAEEKWRNLAGNLRNGVRIPYAGPKAENVIVESDLPKPTKRSSTISEKAD